MLLLAGALIASAAVVYALVRITGPGGAASPSEAPAPTVTSPSQQLLSTGSPLTSPTWTSAAAPMSSAPPGQTRSTGPPAASKTASDAAVPPTTSMRLPGAPVVLPAAWSGTATVTVTVVGECATATPSVYTDIPADLALDLVQNEANAAEVAMPPAAHRDDVALTLGVNTSGVPSLAVYSSQIDATGGFQRYWNLGFSPGPDRTDINGTLIDQSADGTNPNLMVDAETSLQPCEAAGTVSLPRALAEGSTMHGWVSASAAQLTVDARTTDGKRTVEVQVDLTRKQ